MADGAQVFPAGRVPPNDLDAEAAVLSACLHDQEREVLDETRQILTPRHFYAHANATIFEAMLSLDAEGQPTDVVTVASWLRDRGRLTQIGGTPYLAQLSDATPAVAHVAAHARLVAGKARQRDVIAYAHKLVAEGYGNIEDPRCWALDAAQGLTDVAATGEDDDPAETMEELMPRVFGQLSERAQAGGKFRGVETGWKALSEFLGGWERGKMHVIAARPGMGKTAMVMGACINVAKAGHPACMVSAEMDKDELVERALAVEANVSLTKIRAAKMNQAEWAAVTAASAKLKTLPIILKHRAGAKLFEVRSEFRKATRRFGRLGLGVVDYLQVLDGERRDGDSRESEVSGLSRGLMWMASEFDMPLLAVSQLNRGVEARSNQNKRPSLGDLRESGAIEQDAYTVAFLYRDDYYNKESQWAGTVEVIVGKNRSGPTGMVRLRFLADSTSLVDLDNGQESLPDYDPNDPRWAP